MLVERITSRQNPLVRRFRQVRAGAERHLVFLEGVRLREEAFRAGVHFESIAFSPDLKSTDRGNELLDSLKTVRCRGAFVSGQVMEAIADTDSPQGVAAIVIRPHAEMEELFKSSPSLIVIADELQDPGNIGTIIRTSEAAGADAVITSRNTVDPFNRKALRASMGSALRLPIVDNVKMKDVMTSCRKAGIRIIATRAIKAADGKNQAPSTLYCEADLKNPFALILGREGSGLPASIEKEVELSIYIPMKDSVDSLNVATAAAIILYESARQRKFASQTSR